MDSSSGYAEYAFIAELYDHVVPYRDRPDVAFYVEQAKRSGGPVLEIGSGTGRVLVPTARAGVQIVGLDSSTAMLEVCRQRLAEEPQAIQNLVQLVQGDMRQFELDRLFGLVTIPFRPFQHLITVADQIACLENIHRHLAPDGRLVFDVFNPSLESLTDENFGEEIGDEPPFTTPDGKQVTRKHRVVDRDRYAQINYVELIYYVTYPDGMQERLVHSFPMRYLFRFEAEHLLARCGFEVERVYADFDLSPYGSKYPGELIFVARKLGG